MSLVLSTYNVGSYVQQNARGASLLDLAKSIIIGENEKRSSSCK